MDLTHARYTQSLADYARQKGTTFTLTQLRDTLFAKIQTGQGKTLVTTAPVGKTFSFQVTMTVEEQFAAVVEAIKIFNDTTAAGGKRQHTINVRFVNP